MLDRCKQISVSLFSGYLLCLLVTSVVNADGRVFVVNLRNSSGLEGLRDAERACAFQQSRLASAQELHHAVVECFFSPCTRGWLYGGSVGTTVCNVVGGALKAVDVRTENTTGDNTHLNAFCIKDRGVLCGDPPSFPNARLQGHSGYEMGDELLYTCVPGFLMPSGHRAFSLLCDSCGEWYGLVEICVKDETVGHVDYEDKFPDSHEEADHHNERPAEAHGEVYEEVHGAANPSQKPQETSFSVETNEEHQDQHEEHEVEGEVIGIQFGGRDSDEERPVEDFIGHPRWEQERKEVVTTDAAPVTQEPVSLLSQKHMFWFPSEAFQEDPVSTNPSTQTTQRASGAQSEESKEQESQESKDHHQRPVHVDDHDHEPDDDDHNTDDQDDHNDSHHHDQDGHEDSHHDDQDDPDSHQEEDDHDDHVKHHIPDRRDSHEKHDDHYDMGEHEEERDRNRDRVRYGSQEYDDTYDEHEGYEDHEDHEDLTDDHGKDSREHLDHSEEHPDPEDHDDDQHEEHYDLEEDDNEHYPDHGGHEHDDHDSYDDHDSHEDFDDAHQHVIISIPNDDRQNITQKAAGGKVTTDDTWLDGYPVIREETENGETTTDRLRPEDGGRGPAIRTSDKPNEVEFRGPIPYTNSPEASQSPTDPSSEQRGVEEMLPGFTSTPAPSQPSDSPSYPDTLDYDTQQAAPTHSWLGGPTEYPFLDQDPAPPMQDSDVLGGVIEEHTLHNLPGEAGERGEIEGEMGEAMCPGENCTSPPPSSSSRGPTVAAIIAVVCLVAAAVIIGVWCYRRQQQKSSMYELNGKGQSQSRQGQHIEMQQKV